MAAANRTQRDNCEWTSDTFGSGAIVMGRGLIINSLSRSRLSYGDETEGERMAPLLLHSARSQLVCITVLLTFAIPANLGAQAPCDSDPYQFAINRIQALEKKYKNSIILVNCGGELPEVSNIGTGFLIDSKVGLFLTAHHVVKNRAYDCTTPDSKLLAYAAGDMCQQTELEYVTALLKHDVALLRVKPQPSKHFFYNKPHFELLTQGMTVNENELVMMGFSQFAATLRNEEDGSPARRKLPGAAGGNKCTGQPQPYKFNPVVISNQKIDGTSPSFLRGSDVREGDSGAPIFLADGRVGGVVIEIGFGTYTSGTKVTSASDIVTWLVTVLGSNETLKDHASSIEEWTVNQNIYDALNPDVCSSSNSCVSNVRIAAELQRIPTKAVSFERFTKQQLEKLACPLYTAAQARDIRPQMFFLRDKLTELGFTVAAQGNTFASRAWAFLGNPKYTAYTKMAALELAEATFARQLDGIWQKDPDVLAGAICASGLDADQTEPINSVVDNYLQNFRQAESFETRQKIDSCPETLSTARLKQVKLLTATLSNVKTAQAAFAKKRGGPSDTSSSAAAAALAALVNAGDKQEANALIDLGDAFVEKNPELAASAYAKAFEVSPSTRAVSGFGDAVSRSPELRSKVVPKINPGMAEWKKAISSFPTIDQNSVAAIIRDPGLRPGAM
jgi:Trypsin-like peptidase domain